MFVAVAVVQQRGKVNADFVNPFLESVVNILSTMAGIKVTPGQPALKSDDVAKGDVTAINRYGSATNKENVR